MHTCCVWLLPSGLVLGYYPGLVLIRIRGMCSSESWALGSSEIECSMSFRKEPRAYHKGSSDRIPVIYINVLCWGLTSNSILRSVYILSVAICVKLQYDSMHIIMLNLINELLYSLSFSN